MPCRQRLSTLRHLETHGRAEINRALLSAKAEELDKKIKELTSMRDGLRHAAVCKAPNHFECISHNFLKEKPNFATVSNAE